MFCLHELGHDGDVGDGDEYTDSRVRTVHTSNTKILPLDHLHFVSDFTHFPHTYKFINHFKCVCFAVFAY